MRGILANTPKTLNLAAVLRLEVAARNERRNLATR